MFLTWRWRQLDDKIKLTLRYFYKIIHRHNDSNLYKYGHYDDIVCIYNIMIYDIIYMKLYVMT